MNENETNPRPADAGAEHLSTERVESEQPTAAQPPVAPQPAVHQSAASPSGTHPTQPLHDAQPTAHGQNPWAQPTALPPAHQPAAPQPPGAQTPQSAWQQQPPVSVTPATGQPYAPGYQAYGQQQPAYGPYAPQPGYPATGSWQHGGQHSAQHGTTQTDGSWQPGATQTEGVVPVWAQAPGGQPQRSGRGRKILMVGASAVLIALLSGGVGAATAMAVHDDSPAAVQTGNSSVTRVVDRSSLAQIAAAVQDSVVSITTASGEGSGVVMSADGYIVTNNHVVATASGDTVNIIFADGKKATATIVGTDPRTDLAVVKANDVSGLKAATFGDSSKMQVGDTVLALGSPLGLEGSVTAGIISAKDRTIESSSEEEQQQGQGQTPFGGSQQQQQQSAGSTTMTGLLQTDAPINPGNSGGALVNTNGEVIGINSAIATSGSSSGNIGLGFSIPSNKAVEVAKTLMNGKKVSHPALGVSVTTAENGGALVSQVTANSAAAKAGFQQGDVITKVDGKNISESDDLVAVVQAGSVGQKLDITFTRNGSEKSVTVTLAESQ